ncbi:MAG TPA: hypothetical protein DCE39_15960 [Planctomycetaceae bacterium]|nr:hypothetical protein [Planctomycetaceae bacterium]
MTRYFTMPPLFSWSRTQLNRWFKQQSRPRRKMPSAVSGESLESRELLSAVAAEVTPLLSGASESGDTTASDWDVEFCDEIPEGLADSIFVSVGLADGRLEIDGSRNDDSIVVNVLTETKLSGVLHGESDSGERHLQVKIGGRLYWSGDYDEVDSIRFLGRSGDDHFDNRTAIPVSAFGGLGNDELIGGSGDDDLYGGPGNDVIEGAQGDDEVHGGDGQDVLSGNGGDDILLGGDGNDSMSGGNGSDSLLGEDGRDEIDGDGGMDFVAGGDGRDVLNGGSHQDTLDGGSDRDILYGGTGNDVLYGNSGNDSIEGGRGEDSLYGEDGVDVLEGGAGQDVIRGGADADYLYGGYGHDQLYGDAGDDVVYGEDGDDRLEGGSGDDSLDGDGGNDRLFGDSGADLLKGDSGDDMLSGGSGKDRLYGHSGADVLYGGTNDDKLDGGSGNDVLHGGQDDDSLWGGTGDDNLYGEKGRDVLRGQKGDDGMYGGSGTDRLYGGSGQDRFLYHDSSEIRDDKREDAKLKFKSGEKNWLMSEVEAVDSALAILHHAVGDDTLLKESGWLFPNLVFVRDARHPDSSGSSTVQATNSGGTVTYFDSSFSGTTSELMQVVFHEIGHNWDDENPGWSEFKDLSGWKRTVFDRDPGSAYEEAGTLFSESEDNNWWYLCGSEFASSYGDTSPREDFATTFAFYFMDLAGLDYPDSSLDSDNAATKRRLGDKYEFMADWIRTL